MEINRAVRASAHLAAWLVALPFGLAEAAPVTRSGTIKVAAAVDVSSGIPAGTPITATARVLIFDGPGAEGRLVERSAVLTRTGARATATLLLPYSWRLQARQRSPSK